MGNWEGAYALPEPYVAALRAAGARTALLPPSQPAQADEVLAAFDGLLLAGGGDIEPARYGAADHPDQYGTDPDRDELELELARAAVRLGTPTLGICRGVQLLNVAFGGTLVQHLPELDAWSITATRPSIDARPPVEPAAPGRGAGQSRRGPLPSPPVLTSRGRGPAVAWAPTGWSRDRRDQGGPSGCLASEHARHDWSSPVAAASVDVASGTVRLFGVDAPPVGFGGPGSAAG